MIGTVIVLGLTAAGSLLALSRPLYGVLVYVCFAIVRPTAMWPWSLPDLPYSQIVVIAALIGFALSGFRVGSLNEARLPLIALVFYLAWAALSAFAAPMGDLAWQHFDSQIRIIVPCILAILVSRTHDDARLLAWAIALSEGFVAFRFNEFYYQLNINLPLDSFAAKGRALWALDMVVAATFCFFLILASQRLWQKALLAVLCVLSISAVLITFSRGGQLGLLTAGAMMFVYLPKRPRFFGLYIVGVVVVLSLAGPSVMERFASTFADEGERDASAQSRIVLWQQMSQIVVQEPLLGVGPNHFPSVAKELGWGTEKEGHNHWLQVAAELGIPAAIALLFFYLHMLRRLWQWRRPPPDEQEQEQKPKQGDAEAAEASILGGAVMTATMAFFVCSQFISIDLLEIPVIVATLGCVLLKVSTTSEAQSGVESTDPAKSAGWAPMARTS